MTSLYVMPLNPHSSSSRSRPVWLHSSLPSCASRQNPISSRRVISSQFIPNSLIAVFMLLTLTRVNIRGKNFDTNDSMGLRDDAAGPVAAGGLPARQFLDPFGAFLRDRPLSRAVHAQQGRRDVEPRGQLLLREVVLHQGAHERGVV